MDTNLIFAGKPVENRTWEPPAGALGTEFVVHAGKAWAPAGAALAAELGITGFDDPRCCPGGYLGTVRLVVVHLAVGRPVGPTGPRHLPLGARRPDPLRRTDPRPRTARPVLAARRLADDGLTCGSWLSANGCTAATQPRRRSCDSGSRRWGTS